MARNSFFSNEEGVTAIEYGLLIGLIALLIIGATQIIGTTINDKLGEISSDIDNSGG